MSILKKGNDYFLCFLISTIMGAKDDINDKESCS